MINVIQNTIGSLARRGSETPSFTGLLDTYSGAAVGYSLRRLRTAYSGNCVKVRRASDSTELDIGFVNNVLDTASLATFCSGTDGFVSVWYDQSVNGKDIANASAVQQPQIVASGSIIAKGGKPAIKNIGNGYLSIATAINLTDFACAFVYEELNNGKMTWGNGTSYYYRHQAASHTLTGVITSPSTLSNGDYVMDFINRNSGSVQSYFNNVSAATATSTNNYEFKDFLNGYNFNYGYNSPVQEFVLWTSEQSANRVGIQGNINAHYSIYP